MPEYYPESITFSRHYGQNSLDHCVEMLHTRKQNGRLITTQSRKFYPAVIPADGKIAGYLPAPKEATQIPELDAILKEYGQMYSMLYDADGTDSPLYTYDDVERADAWGRENPYLVGGLSNYRQDLFSSDREIVALHWTLTCEPGVRKMPVQKPVTPVKPQPKPAQKKFTGSKNMKFPSNRYLMIDGEMSATVNGVTEYANRYDFNTVDGNIFRVMKNTIVSISNDVNAIRIETNN